MPETLGELTNWHIFNSHAITPGPEFFGFKCQTGDVNRFAARYRAASCFKGISLDGFSANTQAGYGALCRVLFVYSAFEAYVKVIGETQQFLAPSLAEFGAQQVLSRIRLIDVEDRFYRFIYERVNETHKRELDRYFNSDPCNIAYLASAIRHIFAHGWLSPNAGGGESLAAVEISDLVSDFLLSYMNASFARAMEDAIRSIYGE